MLLKQKIIAGAALSLILGNHVLWAEKSVTYKNKRGSSLELNFSRAPELTGSFTTAVASKECQQVIGTKRPIVGYVNGTTISFSVFYPTCGTVSWTGNIAKDQKRIDSIAINAHQASSSTGIPGAQIIAHDIFKAEAKAKA